MRLRLSTLALLVLLMTYELALATSPLPLVTFGELTEADQRQLEHDACLSPHGLRLVESTGFGYEGDESAPRSADAVCAPHSSVRGQAVSYATSCKRHQHAWECESPTTVIDAKFDDRRLFIRADMISFGNTVALSVSDADAYDVIASLVRAKMVPPGEVTDDIHPGKGKFDECRVARYEPDVYAVHCHTFRARVKKVVGSVGVSYTPVVTN